MRTKALLFAAAFAVAASSVSAQSGVYSVNAVGYVTSTYKANEFTLMANQLDRGGAGTAASLNTLPNLIPTATVGSKVFKYFPTTETASGGYKSVTYLQAGWQKFDHDNNSGTPAIDMVLDPGEGAFIQPKADLTVTFVGDVLQGSLSSTIPLGFSIQSSIVPQSLNLKSNNGSTEVDLEFPATTGDRVFFYRGTGASKGYVSSTFLGTGNWAPTVPKPEVGESFFVDNKGAVATWERTFSVNSESNPPTP